MYLCESKKKEKNIEFKDNIDKSIFLIFHYDFNNDLKKGLKRQFFHDITTLFCAVLCTKDYLDVLNFKIAILINSSQFSSLPQTLETRKITQTASKLPRKKKKRELLTCHYQNSKNNDKIKFSKLLPKMKCKRFKTKSTNRRIGNQRYHCEDHTVRLSNL